MLRGMIGSGRRLWRRIEGALARQGYVVQWRPRPLLPREVRLLPDLELALAHLMLTVPRPFVLEIGANDGVANDPLYPFIRRGTLRGILPGCLRKTGRNPCRQSRGTLSECGAWCRGR